MLPGPAVVPPYGPLDAPIAWVGESPGFEEEKELRPFCGPSGIYARKALNKFGISDSNDVLWTNVCPVKVFPWPSNAHGDKLIHMYAGQLDETLAQMTGCKVVVACGAVALRRLTGFSDLGSWQGAVLRRDDVPGALQWHRTLDEYPLTWPTGAVCVPIWHPSGILRDIGREAGVEFYATIRKVSQILAGTLPACDIVHQFYPSVGELNAALGGAQGTDAGFGVSA